MVAVWDEFPSPYGDFVFQQFREQGKQRRAGKRFRPLTGILFFNYLMFRANGAFWQFVSVPLRGFCFSTKQGRKKAAYLDRGFRPLTGILFFNIDNNDANAERFVYVFPSPYGDFVFQQR